MTAMHHIYRTLALAAGLVAAGASQAQTWDMDACTGGTKAASGYTNCGTGTAAHGTLSITAYSTNSASSNFTTASTSINNGGTYLGVWSGNEGQSGSTTAQVTSRSSPHHAIDNFSAYGNAYELVHLQFSKAVDLGTLVAEWANDRSTGDADFQVYRWNYNTATSNPTITSFNPSSMTGWQLVHTGDFDSSPGTGGSGPGSLTQVINDTGYFSSHWLVTTAFGGSNDAFKLGKITAASVCQFSQTSTGGCAPPSGGDNVPEPGSLALAGLALLGLVGSRRGFKAAR